MASSKLDPETGIVTITTPGAGSNVGDRLYVVGHAGDWGYSFPDWAHRLLSPHPNGNGHAWGLASIWPRPSPSPKSSARARSAACERRCEPCGATEAVVAVEVCEPFGSRPVSRQLASEVERIGSSAQFNGIQLLSAATNITFQVGAQDGEVITVSTISLGSGVPPSAFQLTVSGSDISEIDAAIDAVSAQRAQFGAVQNRLEHTLSNLAIYQENLTASESRIRDVDMAAEMVNFTKLQILQQAGTSMLAQANTAPQSVLSLLR